MSARRNAVDVGEPGRIRARIEDMANSNAPPKNTRRQAGNFARDWQVAEVPIRHEPPPGVALTNVPTIRGRAGAHRWLNDVLGVPVRLNYVRAATAKGELTGVRMSGALFFSTQDLFDWIMSRYDEGATA